MTKSKRLLVTAAALAGLYAGAVSTKAYAEEKAGTPAKEEQKDKASCGGKDGCKAKESCKAKDSCKAKESCKAKDCDKPAGEKKTN